MNNDLKGLSLKFVRFLRDYENNKILFDDLRENFTYDELITILFNTSETNALTSILKDIMLPSDFQDLIDQRLEDIIEVSIHRKCLLLVSDDAVLEQLLNLEDINCMEYEYISLLKTDEARISALKIKMIKSNAVAILTVLKSFDDDNLKLKYMRMLKSDDFSGLFSSIKDPRIQETVIQKYPEHCGGLISLLDNEEMRIYYYERYFKKLDGNSRTMIFATFSEENKERYLERYWKQLSEGEKISQLSLIEKDEVVLTHINMLKSDILKIKLINKLSSDKDSLARQIEKTIKYDRSKKLVKQMKKDRMLFVLSQLNVSKLFSNNTDREKLKIIQNSLRNEEESLLVLSTMKKMKNIEKIINHYDELPLYDDKYNELIIKYAENYNLNSEHLIQAVKIFGLEILKNIRSDNLQRIINFDDKLFEKTMQLFDVNKHQMDMTTLNDHINIFLQRKFKTQNPKIINISSDIRMCLQNGDSAGALGLVNKIICDYDVDSILKKYNYTIEQFQNGILENKMDDDQFNKCFFEITNGYIVYMRNKYVQENIKDCYEKFCSERLDAKEALSFVMENFPVSMIRDKIFNPRFVIPKYGYSKEEIEFINHPTALEDIIRFRRNPSQYKSVPDEVKKYMPVFNKIFAEMFDNKIDLENFSDGFKKVYHPFKMYDLSVLTDAFLTLEPEVLQNGILSDDRAYQSLCSVLEKYKLFGLSEWMRDEFSTVELDANGYTIGNLINYFPIIYRDLSKKLENVEIKSIKLPSLLDIASCYGVRSDKVAILLGKENARLISSNPMPNSSGISKEERISKSTEYLKVMFQRKTVTVPSYDEDFELSNGKKINVVVGNVTDPINLTYGERTGACMRIGGHADSLFDFCLTNENGFHIRFSNPENDNFVSRVSGFRNGNTVFLNELRLPKDARYTAEDVKEACVLAARLLIEKSKDSSHPIENVVVHPSYVMESSEGIELNVSNIKKGVGKFYTDVSETNATIVATSDPNDSLVPVKLGNSGVPRYQVQRGKVRMYSGENCYEPLSRIEMLDQILSGVPIEDAQLNQKENVMVAYCGEDWYVSVNSEGKIGKYVMKNSNRKEEARMEMNACLQKINNQLGFTYEAETIVTQNVGGVKK